MIYAKITGTGFHVPERVVTNDDLKQYFDTTDEWIIERTGIRERRWVTPPCGPADLAKVAAEKALAEAGLAASDIDMIVFATLSPEAYFPGSGCFLQDKMDLGNIPALDIRMQCSGFVYALSVAEQYIKRGVYKNILVCGAEVQSTGLDLTNEGRTVGVLFGDGAGVVVLSATDQPGGVISTHLHTQGKYARELWQEEPNSALRPKFDISEKSRFPYMNGREVFKHAIVRMNEAIQEALASSGWSIEEVDVFIPHQANYRIAQAVAEHLGQPMEKFYMNIQRYGNTTAASIPICIAEAKLEGLIKPKSKVLLFAFGSGFTWASAAIEW